MCGILGVLKLRPSAPIQADHIRQRLALLSHRGPDQSGVVEIDSTVILGHCRLSLLDPSEAGRQPMQDRTGRYTIVYNGEVYNFRDLQHSLGPASPPPRSATDTEILLEHLVRHRTNRPAALLAWDGMFALALYDRQERTLFLARDRFGIKPLFYARRPDAFWFASEIKPLLDSVDGRLDKSSFTELLRNRFLESTRHTLVEGIRRLEPGSWLTIDAEGREQSGRFFQLSEFIDESFYRELDRQPFPAIVEEFGRQFTRSVRFTLIADAPVASLASGGVDSSLVSAVAHGLQPGIHLYHVDVQGPRTSERHHAEALARHVGASLTVCDMDDRRWLQAVVRTAYYNETPLLYHPNSIPFMLLCERIHQDGVKAILTGEGADETFLGYPRLVLSPYLEAARRFASLVGRAPTLPLALRLHSRFEFAEASADVSPRLAFLPGPRERAYFRHALGYLQYHLYTVLHRNDRMGMAHSIESRFPFLGTSLVRFALNLPVRHRIRLEPRLVNLRHPFLVDKAPLRHYAHRHIPRHLAFRRKLGFPIRQQDRVRFAQDFLRRGFFQEEFQLTDSQLGCFVKSLHPSERAAVFFTEIWGRLYLRRQPLQEVEHHVAVTCTLA